MTINILIGFGIIIISGLIGMAIDATNNHAPPALYWTIGALGGIVGMSIATL